MDAQQDKWFADDAEDDGGVHIDNYDITAAPNDFNLVTLGSFVDRGAIRIPGFQRHFVWDLPRASRLIESLLLGLPVPQLFLYEEARNRFLVIDGQQRLMSIYYFIKGRFPRQEHRQKLRAIFDDEGRIPDEVLSDDECFRPFKLGLAGRFSDRPSRFDGLDYDSLGEYQSQFDLRPLRNIVVKQVSPSDDDSSVFEIFNRLNTGGMNLRPQEIRTSMYHSPFYTMLYDMNTDGAWRSLLGSTEPDLHLKDIEVLLRGFAMLLDESTYAPSMLRFLNRFSKKCKTHDSEQNEYLKGLFESFLGACRELPGDAFLNPHDSRFNIMLYEAVFTAACGRAFEERRSVTGALSPDRVRALRKDREFNAAAASKSLVLAAASYFERRMTEAVLTFVEGTTNRNVLITALVRNKAVSRQYHTWFQWEGSNANSFFGLFGNGFRDFMKARIRGDGELDDSVRAFLELGRERNRLVHQNFGVVPLEKTTEEIHELYRRALLFVESVPAALREFDSDPA